MLLDLKYFQLIVFETNIYVLKLGGWAMAHFEFVRNHHRICIYIEKCVIRVKRLNFNLSKYLNLLDSNKGLENTISI